MTPTPPDALKTGRRLLAAAALATALLASACGGDDADLDPGPAGSSAPAADPGSSAPSPAADGDGAVVDACTLLSPDDIEAVTGTTYDDGALNEPLTTADQSVCEFSPADGGMTGFVTVLVNHTGSMFAEQRASADENLPTPSVDVEGLGDEAYWSDDTDTVATHVGSVFVQLTLAFGEQETVVDLTRAVLASL